MKGMYIVEAGLYFLLACITWAVAETTYFLIAYGWHVMPINQAEEICDFIAYLLFLASVFCFAWYGLLNLRTNDN